MSALTTILFNTLDIRETVVLFGRSFDWKWFTLVAFLFFLGFVAWWIGGLESDKRQKENSKPNLVFTESREYPLFVINTGQPIYHGLQIWFKNKPRIPTDDSVAKDVTATIAFYDRNTKKKLDIYGCFILTEAYDFAGNIGVVNKLDNVPPNDEPLKLQIALKWQDDESAYGFARESFIYSKTQDGKETIREINKGTHYVKVQLSGTRVDQQPLWFILDNLGQGKALSLSKPIKKPNLCKEGFQTE